MPSNLKLLTFSLACVLAITACDKKERETKTPTQEETVSVVEMVPNCDDASIKNGLVQALASQINGHLDVAVASYNNADSLDLVRKTQQRLSELSLDLENARNEGDVCQINAIINLSANDIKYANRHFEKSGLPSLDEQIANLKATLDNGRLIIPVSYQLVDGKVSLSQAAPALNVVTELMTASAYMMATGAGRVTITRPSVTVAPLPPTEITRPDVNPQPDTTEINPAQDNTTAEPTPTPTPATPSQEPPIPTGDGEITIVETDETY